MKHSDAKQDMAMMKSDLTQDKSMMQAAVNKHEGRMHKGEPKTKLANGGMVKGRGDGIAIRGKTNCKMY